MTLDDMVRALTIILRTALDSGTDLRVSAGTEC